MFPGAKFATLVLNGSQAIFNKSDGLGAAEETLRTLLELEKTTKRFNKATNEIAFKFMVIFVILGTCAVILNIIIFGVIVLNPKRILKQVFYILVMNFTVIDIFRGVSMILWSVRILKPEDLDFQTRLVFMKIDQIALMVLRFCTLCTIFNLLLITLNEYIFIQYSLRYARIVNTGRTLVAIIITWFLSLIFVFAATYARNYSKSIHTVFVQKASDSTESSELNNATNLFAVSSESSKVPDFRFRKSGEGSEMTIQHIFNFLLLGICFLCLLVVLFCYYRFFKVVRRFQKQEELVQASFLEQRRISEASDRSDSQDPDRRVKNQILRRHKHALVIGLVILVYLSFLIPYATIQLLQYFTFNVNTAGNWGSFSRTKLVIRMTMQLLFGLHAVLQPLCYFRMREFRKLLIKTCRCNIIKSSAGYTTAANSYYDPSYMAEASGALNCNSPTPRKRSRGSATVLATSGRKTSKTTKFQPNGILATKRVSQTVPDNKLCQQVSFAKTPSPPMTSHASATEMDTKEISFQDSVVFESILQHDGTSV